MWKFCKAPQSPALSMELLHSPSYPPGKLTMLPTSSIIHHFQTKHLSKETLVFLNSPTTVMMPRQEPGQKHTGISSGKAEAVHQQLQQNISREIEGLSDEQSVYLFNTPLGNSCVGHKVRCSQNTLTWFISFCICLTVIENHHRPPFNFLRKQAEAPLGKRLKKRYQPQPSSSQVSAEAVH